MPSFPMPRSASLIANYRTHTARCNHVIGTDREYVGHARAYPYAPFFKIAAEAGNPVIFVFDAYGPAAVRRGDTARAGKKTDKNLGFSLIEKAGLRSPFPPYY